MSLSTQDSSKGLKKVFFDNGVYLGDFVMNDDGYWVFWPDKNRGGYWDEYLLRLLVDKLAEMNFDWDQEINEYFDAKSV